MCRLDVWAPKDVRRVEIVKDTHLLKQFGPLGGERHVEYKDRLEAPA